MSRFADQHMRDWRHAGSERVLLIVCAMLVVCLSAYFAIGNARVPVSGGLGWDGKIYGACATDLPACLEAKAYSEYSLSRIFPSALMHGVLSLSGEPFGTADVVEAYALVNLLMTCLGILVWVDCCRRSGIRPATAAFGIVSLYVNFQMLRMAYYVPVSTDYFAIFFALLALWSHCAGRPWIALLLVIPAGLTWPAAIPVLLMIGLVGQGRMPAKTGPPQSETKRKAGIFATLVALVYLSVTAYFLWVAPAGAVSGASPIQYDLAALSIVISVVYVGWVAYGICSTLPALRISLALRSILLAAAVYLLYRYLVFELGKFAGMGDPMGIEFLARAIATSGLIWPGLFIAAHNSYLGPWAVLFACFVPSMLVKTVHSPALYCILAFGCVFFLLSESRLLTFFAPFLVFGLCLAIDDFVKNRFVMAIAAIALLISHAWMKLPDMPFKSFLEQPGQTFAMHIGPWMTGRSYAVALLQVAVVLAVCVASWRLSSSTGMFGHAPAGNESK